MRKRGYPQLLWQGYDEFVVLLSSKRRLPAKGVDAAITLAEEQGVTHVKIRMALAVARRMHPLTVAPVFTYARQGRAITLQQFRAFLAMASVAPERSVEYLVTCRRCAKYV